MSIFDNIICYSKISFELTKYELDTMYDILINNLKKIFDDINVNESDKEKWKNNIKNNDYNFILIYDKGDLCAYLEYCKKDDCYYLSDIEIDDNHKGNNKTFKTLMIQFYKNIDDSKIYCYINKENKKSLNVFSHIGIIKLTDKKYQLIYENLEKYVMNKENQFD